MHSRKELCQYFSVKKIGRQIVEGKTPLKLRKYVLIFQMQDFPVLQICLILRMCPTKTIW